MSAFCHLRIVFISLYRFMTYNSKPGIACPQETTCLFSMFTQLFYLCTCGKAKFMPQVNSDAGLLAYQELVQIFNKVALEVESPGSSR